MCLLIVKPPGVKLPHDMDNICEDACRANSDGVGYAIKGHVWKSHAANPEALMSNLIKNVYQRDAAIIHFRLSTSGAIDRENTHPFMIDDGTIFAHNGIISNLSDKKSALSDTAILAKLAKTYENLRERCYHYSDSFNKFAIMPAGENSVEIVGEQHGTWINGLWYSNTHWKQSYWTDFNEVLDDTASINLQDEITDLIVKHRFKNVQRAFFSLSGRSI